MKLNLGRDSGQHFDDSLVQIRKQGLVKILKLKFRQNLKLEFGRYFVADVL